MYAWVRSFWALSSTKFLRKIFPATSSDRLATSVFTSFSAFTFSALIAARASSIIWSAAFLSSVVASFFSRF